MLSESRIDTIIEYRIDCKERLIIITLVGKIGFDDIMGIHGRLRDDPHFDTSFAVLVDGLAADFSTLKAAELRRLAANTPFTALSRRAFVVSPGVNYGLVRMFQSFAEGMGRATDYATFESMHEALAWLSERSAISFR